MQKLSLQELLGAENLAAMKPHIEKVLHGFPQDYEIRIKIGSAEIPTEKIIRATYMPDFDDQGKVRGFFSVISDMTEVRLKEKPCIRLRF